MNSQVRILLALLVTGALLTGCDRGPGLPLSEGSGTSPLRIVSLAPSLTEILFALDLGGQVVGVTDFCDYPKAALEKPKVGGFYDANYEQIASLRPSLVVVLKEHEEARKHCRALGIDYLEVDNRSVAAILTSIRTIGERCGAEDEARDLVRTLRDRIEVVREQAANRGRINTLVCIGRAMGSGRIKDVYVAGKGTLYDELLSLAGGVNAYTGRLEYPTVGAEGIVRMNPEVVIDLAADLDEKGLRPEDVRGEWRALPMIDAVHKNRIHILTGDYVTVPGPRFVLLLEDMARAMTEEY
ncbi:MAG: helical backbone metal receptor [Candidatus Pacebacteria bacterium]|nr:helical backbone metal receptor [Candidatus Paceibacterota bacterium]